MFPENLEKRVKGGRQTLTHSGKVVLVQSDCDTVNAIFFNPVCHGIIYLFNKQCNPTIKCTHFTADIIDFQVQAKVENVAGC